MFISQKTHETIIDETFLFEKITDSFLHNLVVDRSLHNQLLNKLVEELIIKNEFLEKRIVISYSEE